MLCNNANQLYYWGIWIDHICYLLNGAFVTLLFNSLFEKRLYNQLMILFLITLLVVVVHQFKTILMWNKCQVALAWTKWTILTSFCARCHADAIATWIDITERFWLVQKAFLVGVNVAQRCYKTGVNIINLPNESFLKKIYGVSTTYKGGERF